jgi:hypothetical protein
MRAEVEPISRGQYFWIVFISVVAGGIYLWPTYVVKTAGPDALYALVGTTAVALLVQAALVDWARRVNRGPYADALRATWGGGLWAVLGGSAVLCLTVDGILLSLFGDMLSTFFYPATPRLVLTGVVAFTAFWIAMRPLATVARNVQFWVPLLLLSVGLMTVLSLQNVHFPEAVVPAPTLAVMPWARAVLGTWFLYANGGLVATMVPAVRWARRPRPLRTTLAATAMQGGILLLFYFIVVGALGLYAVPRLQWPVVYVLGLVNLNAFFIKGVGLFILITWASAMVLFLAVHWYCAAWNLQQAVRSADAGRLAAMVAMVAGDMVVANLIPSVVQARELLYRLVTPVDLGWTVVTVAGSWLRVRLAGLPPS